MNSLRDAAVLLVLVLLAFSVRISPSPDPGPLVPEATAAEATPATAETTAPGEVAALPGPASHDAGLPRLSRAASGEPILSLGPSEGSRSSIELRRVLETAVEGCSGIVVRVRVPAPEAPDGAERPAAEARLAACRVG